MKKGAIYSILSAGLLIQLSCEKIIDVNVKEADRQIVVNAAICLNDSVHHIYLSQSGNYTNGDGIVPISVDSVVVISPSGVSLRFSETGTGTYSLTENITEQGNYNLIVYRDEETLFAQSTSVPWTGIDSIYFVEVEGGGGPGGGQGGGPGGGAQQNRYELHVLFSDSPDHKDYYRIRYSVNGEMNQGYFVSDDALTNGSWIDYAVFRSGLELNDTAQVELWSIDEASYTFYSTIADVLNVNPFTASTPYNPTSNITNGIGVFCVYQRATIGGIVR